MSHHHQDPLELIISTVGETQGDSSLLLLLLSLFLLMFICLFGVPSQNCFTIECFRSISLMMMVFFDSSLSSSLSSSLTHSLSQNCFTCSHCGCKLTVSDYAVGQNGQPYCKPHYTQLFKAAGGKYSAVGAVQVRLSVCFFVSLFVVCFFGFRLLLSVLLASVSRSGIENEMAQILRHMTVMPHQRRLFICVSLFSSHAVSLV